MASWQWFHRLGSPKWLSGTIDRWLPWVLGLGSLLLLVSAVWGLAFTPPDYKQGNSFRIIYTNQIAAPKAYYGERTRTNNSVFWFTVGLCSSSKIV